METMGGYPKVPFLIVRVLSAEEEALWIQLYWFHPLD